MADWSGYWTNSKYTHIWIFKNTTETYSIQPEIKHLMYFLKNDFKMVTNLGYWPCFVRLIEENNLKGNFKIRKEC